MIPHWLLNNPHTQSWLRRGKNGDDASSASINKVLWLSGPTTASARSDLLASLRHHVQTRWAPETHSSLILSVKTSRGQSSLESVLFTSDCGRQSHAAARGPATTHNTIVRAASADETKPQSPALPRAIIRSSPGTARVLRSLLSQLYVYDARLRNLVQRQSAQTTTAGPLHHGEGFETPPCQSRDLDRKLNAAAKNNLSSLTADSRRASQDEAKLSLHSTTADRPGPPITTSRRWSDPIGSNRGSLPDVQARDWRLAEQEASAGRFIGRQAKLDDPELVHLFLDYLGINSTASPTSHHSRTGGTDKHKTIRLPEFRRVFIVTDAADVSDQESVRELLWYLGLLAARSDFSICVATMDLDVIDWSELNGDKWQRPLSDTLLPVVIPDNSKQEIRQYILDRLVPDLEERDAIATKMAERAAGVDTWADMVVGIVNDASEEGVSGEVIVSMLDDITPPRLSTRQSKFNALYSWKLRRLNRTEMSQALMLMQWVMLAPEALRLNELLVAMRLTMLTWPQAGLGAWDMDKTLNVGPAMSLKDIRKATSGEKGINMDSPVVFWRWVYRISQGLLRLESAGTGDQISSEPLALQRVLPADESVRSYFLQGPGFQSLLPLPENPRDSMPSTESFVDGSYCNMLHACLLYLNMSDLESLGRGAKGPRPMADDLPVQEKTQWRKNTEDQRRMVMSSYPFLGYVVDNLVFHLLCPRAYRYFLPQQEVLRLLTANGCRIWRRWTHLAGFSIADAEPSAVLGRASQGAAKTVLDPVYGANYRLERVLRKVWKTALDQQLAGMPGRRRGHLRSSSGVSEGSVVFTLVGSRDPEKAPGWLVPTNKTTASRARSASSPARYLGSIRELML